MRVGIFYLSRTQNPLAEAWGFCALISKLKNTFYHPQEPTFAPHDLQV